MRQNLTLHASRADRAFRTILRFKLPRDLASAAKAQVTQARSAYYPTVYGSLTGVEAENNSRIAAGALNNPIIYDRYANGLTVSQLVTDFGRTHELVKSSNLHAQAQQENVVTTRADVLLHVDQAYFAVLKAQAVLAVAQETVKAAPTRLRPSHASWQKNKIKSGLDVSFANVDLAQAQLLLIQAQNDLQASFAQLSAALGYSRPANISVRRRASARRSARRSLEPYSASSEGPARTYRPAPRANSAHSYATAERDLWLPTISALGTAGLTPFARIHSAPRYAAAGFNVNIPIFNGHLFGALHTEARCTSASARTNIFEICKIGSCATFAPAWLNANSAFQRLSVTEQLLNQANLALDLAQSRYKLGLSSIIELSQAQLNQTQAQIEQASAKYDYEAQYALLNYQLGALR